MVVMPVVFEGFKSVAMETVVVMYVGVLGAVNAV